MTATATLLRPGNQHKKTAVGTVTVGTVALSPEGNVVVMMGLRNRAEGFSVAYDNGEVYRITKGAIAFTEGDAVYFDGVDVQKTGFVRVGRCVADAVSGDGTVDVRLLKDSVLTKYVRTTVGTALTNSTTPTNLATCPSIPANVLKVGDKIRIQAQVIATATNSTDTLNLKPQIVPASGSTIELPSLGAFDVATNDIWLLDFELTVRVIGASGKIVGMGSIASGVSGTVTLKGVYLAETTINTTIGQTIGVQGTWSVADAGNSCRLDILSAELIRN
jgi:hypothetical protein